jgi:D-amino-acid dehydrogenase
MTQVAPQDIAVIGAGIVGLATALTLQQDGHRVTLIDRQDPGAGTSFGNAGVISVSGITPVGYPGIWRDVPKMLLDPDSVLRLRWSYLPRALPWLLRFLAASSAGRVDRIAREMTPLITQAFDAHDKLMRRHGIDGIVKRVGWLKVYPEDKIAGTRADVALMRKYGVKIDELNADELRQLEPGLHRRYTRAVFSPDSGFASTPLKLSQAYAAAIRQGGGKFVMDTVRGISIGADGAPTIATDAGATRYDRAVIAAGAFSKPFAAMVGARVPLDTERGYHLYLKLNQARGVGRPTYFGDHGFVLAPMEDGIRLTSGVEIAGVDAPPDYRRIRRMAALAKDALPGIGDTPEREWLGFRPSMPDSKPVIGPAPASDRVTLAFGHGHLGLTLSAITGQCVADLVAGRAPAAPVAPFAATRFRPSPIGRGWRATRAG